MVVGEEMAVRPEVLGEEILEIRSTRASAAVLAEVYLEAVHRPRGSVYRNVVLATEGFRLMPPLLGAEVMEEKQELDVETLVLETRVYESLVCVTLKGVMRKLTLIESRINLHFNKVPRASTIVL